MGYLSHPYAWRRASASFAGATVERLQYRDTLDVVIRFADWRGERFQTKALEIGENELLVLIGDAIERNVFSSTMLQELLQIVQNDHNGAGAVRRTISKVLSNDLIEVIDRNDELGNYTVAIEGIEKAIQIDISRLPYTEKFRFHRSHNIRTPSQPSAYAQAGHLFESAADALDAAISGLTDYYEQAIEDGHKVADSWLVKA